MNPAISLISFSSENNMDPKINEILSYLPALSDIEEIIITWVHVVMKVYWLSKGHIGYKGNILNLE